jgi:phage terminase large subunit
MINTKTVEQVTKLTDLIAPAYYSVHNHLKKDRYNEYWLYGGRASLKSTFISIEIVLGLIQDENVNAVVFRKIKSDMRDSVFGQFIWTIEKMGLTSEFIFTVSPLKIIYARTKQAIFFKGCDKPEKQKSVNIGKGHIKYIWFEELDQFNGMAEIRTVIQSFKRGESAKAITFFSYNPPKSPRSWVNKEKNDPPGGRFCMYSNYLEVPQKWLGQEFITMANELKARNIGAYNHEYLGQVTGTGAEVFNNLKFREIYDEEVEVFDNIYQGVDWGFAVDPWAFIRLYYNKTRQELYLVDELGGTSLSNPKSSDMIKKAGYDDYWITADSAEPKSVADYQQAGLKTKGAKKGKGSIEYGIKWLAGLRAIIIDRKRTPRAAREFENYCLDRDAKGELIDNYPDKDNHWIDATRYAVEEIRKGKWGW